MFKKNLTRCSLSVNVAAVSKEAAASQCEKTTEELKEAWSREQARGT